MVEIHLSSSMKIVEIHRSSNIEMGGNPSAKNKIRWLSIWKPYTKSYEITSKPYTLSNPYRTQCSTPWHVYRSLDDYFKRMLRYCFHERHTGAWGMDFVSSSPLFTKFSYNSFLFQNFHNHSFFLHLTISVDVIHHE